MGRLRVALALAFTLICASAARLSKGVGGGSDDANFTTPGHVGLSLCSFRHQMSGIYLPDRPRTTRTVGDGRDRSIRLGPGMAATPTDSVPA